MSLVPLPIPTLRPDDSTDRYGHARLPASAHAPMPEHVDQVPYGRFRNLYLYITEACQLRCEHCYMGERLDRALKMPYDKVVDTLRTWRKLGSSKLTILGGEPTLHPDYIAIIRAAGALGFGHVITTSNGLDPAWRKFRQMRPSDFAYVQISLDGGSAASHDQIRGPGRFDETLRNVARLAEAGFDTRIICTVNKANAGDALQLLDIADQLGVSLVKYHVFSTIGTGHGAEELAMSPMEWIEFYEQLERVGPGHQTRIWYQPTYARRSRVAHYAAQGYCGCIGRTLDRISVFPDGRCYVCSYLFDTELHFANMVDGDVQLNRAEGGNEFDLFAKAMTRSACGDCKAPTACGGGCPAEELVMGAASCAAVEDIVPVCRLWKADVPIA
ncbi:radical SAM/SPASM domain-containing protein [Actinoplanes sp. NPDC049118]|uniref:radical SAM/SPASM domain-containing protein n=1 Tax=Actinoplanes sp. NPDC049118 TaxID=3155769 RepID=UPI0033F02E4C